jgi:hypothetical protein
MADILIHVEDPGAANMVIGLPEKLFALGCDTQLLASSYAKEFLTSNKQAFSPRLGTPLEILKITKPKVVVVGTSEDKQAFSLLLTHAAQKSGIPTIGMVDMACNAHNRFRGGGDDPLGYVPAQLIVTDQATKDAYIQIGFPAKKISLLGHPAYDRAYQYRQNNFVEPKQNSDRKKQILFLAEGWDLFDEKQSYRSKDYTLEGRGGDNWRTAIVLEELLDALDSLPEINAEVVVRPHPKMTASDFDRFEGEITVEAGGDPLEAASKADAVIGMTSMLLIEAAIVGRPVLSILPQPIERDWLGPIQDGDILSVTNRSDLVKALPSLMAGKIPALISGGGAEGLAIDRIVYHIAACFRRRQSSALPAQQNV